MQKSSRDFRTCGCGRPAWSGGFRIGRPNFFIGPSFYRTFLIQRRIDDKKTKAQLLGRVVDPTAAFAYRDFSGKLNILGGNLMPTTENPSLKPKPDDFLTIIRRQQLGKLKVYLGACAGVGKTYQMLIEGNRLRRQGVDAGQKGRKAG